VVLTKLRNVITERHLIKPGDRVLIHGAEAVVREVIHHPAGTHDGSVIKADLPALQFVTGVGSRWAGDCRSGVDDIAAGRCRCGRSLRP
jgi:hypothetical protein